MSPGSDPLLSGEGPLPVPGTASGACAKSSPQAPRLTLLCPTHSPVYHPFTKLSSVGPFNTKCFLQVPWLVQSQRGQGSNPGSSTY